MGVMRWFRLSKACSRAPGLWLLGVVFGFAMRLGRLRLDDSAR